MKSTDPREQEIHSLAAQLRDCRELLNQTNQELAALGGERNRMAACADELANVTETLIEIAESVGYIPQRARHAINQYEAVKAYRVKNNEQ